MIVVDVGTEVAINFLSSKEASLKVEPTAVPRVIGKQGSMITAIREKTNTRIQIGQNGFIWIDGKGEDISKAQKAIETIDREASSEGLTKKIEKLLEK